MSVTSISLPRPVALSPTESTPAPRRGSPAVPSPDMPVPRPVACGILAGALSKLSGTSPELSILALENESTRLGIAGSQDVVRALGKFIANEHAANQEQFRKAIEAAKHKAWWQKFLIAFKVIAIAASLATGGTVGAIAAGLMVAAWAIEKSHPKVALGLQLAAAAILVTNAATELLASGANSAAVISAGWRAGCKYVAAGAQVGSGIGTAMVGHYSATELRANAARLQIKEQVEQTQQAQRDEIAFLKALYEHGREVERDCNQITEIRNETAAAAIRA